MIINEQVTSFFLCERNKLQVNNLYSYDSQYSFQTAIHIVLYTASLCVVNINDVIYASSKYQLSKQYQYQLIVMCVSQVQ